MARKITRKSVGKSTGRDKSKQNVSDPPLDDADHGDDSLSNENVDTRVISSESDTRLEQPQQEESLNLSPRHVRGPNHGTEVPDDADHRLWIHLVRGK